MSVPEDLLYSKTHEWARIDDGDAIVGITDFAQEQLGDLTYIELPRVGDMVTAGDEMGTVESVKAASEYYSPVDGEVVAVNAAIENNPGLVNDDPYNEGWMVRIKTSCEPKGLLNAEEYQELIDSEEH